MNDVHSGSPARDRNLYPECVEHNGRHVGTYCGVIDTANFAVADAGTRG